MIKFVKTVHPELYKSFRAAGYSHAFAKSLSTLYKEEGRVYNGQPAKHVTLANWRSECEK